MARPKAVQKSADEARSLAEKIVAEQKAMREQGSQDADKSLSEYLDNPPASKKPAEAAHDADGEPESNAPASEDGKLENPASDAQEAHKPPQPEQEQHKRQTDVEQLQTANKRLESAYAVLQGKYNKEVPRLQRELKQAKDEIASLTNQLQSQSSGDEEINDPTMRELLNEYPEDLVKGIYRMVKSATGGQKTNDEGAHKEQLTTDDAQKEIVAARMDLLTEHVPDWRQVDVTDGFKQWLNGVDRMSGRTRLQLMSEAWESDDILRVANFFNTYKQQAGINQRPPPPADRNIEPETRSSQQPSADRPDQRIWTLAEVEEVNARERRGEFRKHPEKLRRLRADIEKAAAEGRLR